MDEGPVGYFGNTDFDWYRHLLALSAEKGPLEEVNFWQPGGAHDFRALRPGEPFLFKLKKPHYAVCGFGFFARASRVPVSLAWEAFGELNGTATAEAFRERLRRLRPGGLAPGEDPDVGCLMISEPVFLGERDWVPQPRDWSRNIVSGKRYALASGEGRRVWEACRGLSTRSAGVELDRGTAAAEERFGAPHLVRPRLGQGTFRVAVTDAYGRSCAVTGEHSLPVLEAAHIRPYAMKGTHELANGLCLRSDIHRLFDRGYVTVDPGMRFRVSPRLRKDWGNGRSYEALDGREIRAPERAEERPDRELLAWHEGTVFRR
ncbi:MAG: HNH endonuclease [Planctomycetaceae bacterium]|nr:HNH endonuclease [Planctomycetota bacterium]NUN51683.1 HNH endonuclease [Planctomycetaceae bacterium]